MNTIETMQWLPPSTNGMTPTMQTTVDGPAFSSAAAVAMVTNKFAANVMGDSAPGINPLASPHAAEAGVDHINLQAQAAAMMDEIQKGQRSQSKSTVTSTGAALEKEEQRAAITAAMSDRYARLTQDQVRRQAHAWCGVEPSECACLTCCINTDRRSEEATSGTTQGRSCDRGTTPSDRFPQLSGTLLRLRRGVQVSCVQ